jgi:hypothetical protein
MAAQPESRFWKKLRKQFPSGHIVRVENPANPGTPDVNACIEGVEFWSEQKQVPKLPKQASTPVFTGCLRPEQVLWHVLRNRAGGRTFICGYVQETEEIFVIPGNLAAEFNSMTLEQLKSSTLKVEEMWKTSSTGC